VRTQVVASDDPAAPRKSPTGAWVTIAVQDTGTGMPPETLGRVFEPFFTTKANGTGLGLATAQQITRELGGEITAESRVGVRTTFTLWLPRLGCADVHPAPVAIPAVNAGTDAVLVVEDEPLLRNLVQIVLAEAGYHVLVASNAKEALA